MAEPISTLQVPSNGQVITATEGQKHFAAFLPSQLDDKLAIFPVVFELIAISGSDQVILEECHRYTVDADTHVVERETGVLVSTVLANIHDSETAIKCWARETARQLKVKNIYFITHEVYTLVAPTPDNQAIQLSFDDLNN